MPVPIPLTGSGPTIPTGPISVVPDDEQSKVRITIVDWDFPEANIYRMDSNNMLQLVRGADPGTLSDGWWQGDDFEMPLDQPVQYRAVYGDNMIQSAVVTVHSLGQWWLKHPGKPKLNIRIVPTQGSLTKLQRAASRGILEPLNRRYPVVVTSRRKAPTASLDAFTATWGDREALDKITDDGAVLLLQGPAGRPLSSEYVSVGDIDQSVFHIRVPGDVWTLPLIVVDRPQGEMAGGFGSTWADVGDAYASWSTIAGAHATWQSLAAWTP